MSPTCGFSELYRQMTKLTLSSCLGLDLRAKRNNLTPCRVWYLTVSCGGATQRFWCFAEFLRYIAMEFRPYRPALLAARCYDGTLRGLHSYCCEADVPGLCFHRHGNEVPGRVLMFFACWEDLDMFAPELYPVTIHANYWKIWSSSINSASTSLTPLSLSQIW